MNKVITLTEREHLVVKGALLAMIGLIRDEAATFKTSVRDNIDKRADELEKIVKEKL